jgi:hypothetical protein
MNSLLPIQNQLVYLSTNSPTDTDANYVSGAGHIPELWDAEDFSYSSNPNLTVLLSRAPLL